MSHPNAPWRDLNLNEEQDELVQAHMYVQIRLARMLKKCVLSLAVFSLMIWANRAILRSVEANMSPVDLPGVSSVADSLVKWGVLGVVTLVLGVMVYTTYLMTISQRRVAELPLNKVQVKRVRQIAGWAVEAALFGHYGYTVLNKVRRFVISKS